MRPVAAETSVSFVARLASFGDRAALVTPAERVSYADLAARVADVALRLGATRRLVMVTGANAVEPVVAYLAALAVGHPVLLVPGDGSPGVAALEAAYDPDVVVRDGVVDVRREGTAHDLHPDLALLLSTSGSTGSPKLVRLSRRNLQANAEAIASYLGIRPTDVAATTLPMHYCFGLSVINSHLCAGASLLLTSLSVVDACFWDAFRAAGATTFAGVPYTFDLLDRVGFAELDLPSLRYVTQAGGRLDPGTVRRYAELGQRRGWDLFVMYGQTEATARMAYLPPDLARTHPQAIGVPIPGGSFRLDPLPELPLQGAGAPEVGELVYRGDNVMLGYAESPADLARGRDVTELRTGDVARRTDDGLLEIVGRRNRFAKMFGLRIDLDQAEKALARGGATALCADGGDRLVVAVSSEAAPVDVARVERIAKEQLGLPPGALVVCPTPDIPRLPTGKPDYRTIASWAGSRPAAPSAGSASTAADGSLARAVDSEEVRRLYAEVLRRPDATGEDTFVTLDGDSLSYVEISLRLEGLLGRLPANWHVTPIDELTPAGSPSTGGTRSAETNVLLRAVAIVLIVGSHANLFALAGGAHLLLGVAGFNFGRFSLTAAPRRERVRRLVGSIARTAVPSVAWIAFAALLLTDYPLRTVLLVNGIAGPEGWSEPAWHYWFIEALVAILAVLALLMAVPLADRLERRWPFWVPVMLAGLGLLTRYEVVVLQGGDVIHRAHIVFWLFALGWAAVKASARWQRALVSALVLATVPGFFDDAAREALVVVGVLLLVWVPALRVPAPVARPAGVLASASLYIYLCHWQIYPHLEHTAPLLATLLSLAGGVAFWRMVSWVGGRVGHYRRRSSSNCRATTTSVDEWASMDRTMTSATR